MIRMIGKTIFDTLSNRKRCFMKRIYIILLLLLILCLMPLQVSANEEPVSGELYFFNPDSLCINVYSTAEAYLNHLDTDFYILNGFPISKETVKYYDDFARIDIYGQNIFCSKNYIIDECPITDLHGFSRLLNDDVSFKSVNPDSREIKTTELKKYKDDVYVFGYINYKYLCKYEQQYGFIDKYVDNGSFAIVNYSFDKQPLFNMMPIEEIRQIAIVEALKYLNIPSLDDFYVDINIYTNIDNPLSSMYIVHVYRQYPDHDVLQIDIDCMTGKVYRCSYAKQVVGVNIVQCEEKLILCVI